MNKLADELGSVGAFLLIVILVCIGTYLIVVGLIIVIPFAVIAVGVYYGYKYATRPVPVSPFAVAEQIQQQVAHASFPTVEAFADSFSDRLYDDLNKKRPLAYSILEGMTLAAAQLYEQERFNNPLPPFKPANQIEEGRYLDQLAAFQRKILNPPEALAIFSNALSDALNSLKQHLPALAFVSRDLFHKQADDEDGHTTEGIPLVEILREPQNVLTSLMGCFLTDEIERLGLFDPLRRQLEQNVEEAGCIPTEFEGSASEMVEAYLKGTAFADIFNVRVPFEVPERARFEHTAIVAGSGWGKTQLLQSIIARDLQKEEPPALIVLDSTGAMIERIQRLAVFDGKLRDRILIIDPAHSPSLNMFDMSTPRFASYSAEQREDVQTEVIGLFAYVFDSADYQLTANMRAPFLAAVRLMLSRPGSTVSDLRQLLEEPSPKTPGFAHSAFKADIEKLDKETQDFFANHFFAASLFPSRTAIARRLHDLIGVPAIRRMFTASANTLDLFAEMQRGSIVVVNTNLNLLKEDGMVLFGRFVVAKALSAALERATLPESQRRPAYLIIDEAAPYFDETFEKLLTRVRQFRLGVVIAFQHLEQASDKLKSAIASSTSIKYAGGVGYSDRRWLAREMESTPEFVGSVKKDAAEPPKWSQFALFVRNFTDQALKLTIPFYQLERMERMSDQAHAALLERNKRRVTAIAAPTPKPAQDAPATVATIAEPQPSSPTPAASPVPTPTPQADHSAPGDY